MPPRTYGLITQAFPWTSTPRNSATEPADFGNILPCQVNPSNPVLVTPDETARQTPSPGNRPHSHRSRRSLSNTDEEPEQPPSHIGIRTISPTGEETTEVLPRVNITQYVDDLIATIGNASITEQNTRANGGRPMDPPSYADPLHHP